MSNARIADRVRSYEKHRRGFERLMVFVGAVPRLAMQAISIFERGGA
ncbi:MAG: hypothetical protein Q8Q80_15550 [Methyloversatilis sp.]|nr:hypothetical protein [Methyloversatilis sp.]MDP3874073.1 hypothetical protein [Methyloversatilis sp.]